MFRARFAHIHVVYMFCVVVAFRPRVPHSVRERLHNAAIWTSRIIIRGYCVARVDARASEEKHIHRIKRSENSDRRHAKESGN